MSSPSGSTCWAWFLLPGIALVEIGAWRRGEFTAGHLRVHAAFVGGFLIVAHIAMIFGMLDPLVLSRA